jgi:prepilin-type processing-associated H-X9-DG protein
LTQSAGPGRTYVDAVNINQDGQGPGRRWYDAHATYTQFFTILPPNGPACASEPNSPSTAQRAVCTASSYHTGGANVCLGDGAVRFISENIDASASPEASTIENYNFGGPSPWGVWGALGTISAGENIAMP